MVRSKPSVRPRLVLERMACTASDWLLAFGITSPGGERATGGSVPLTWTAGAGNGGKAAVSEGVTELPLLGDVIPFRVPASAICRPTKQDWKGSDVAVRREGTRGLWLGGGTTFIFFFFSQTRVTRYLCLPNLNLLKGNDS